MLRNLSRSTLKTIAEVRAPHCLSLYLPTHRFGPQAERDRALLKGLLHEAEVALTRAGASPAQCGELLDGIHEMLDEPLFWQQQGSGLALLSAPGKLWPLRLATSPEPRVAVAERFLVAPLIAALPPADRFYVLALSLAHPRVLEVTTDGVRRLDLAAMPQGMEEALGYQQYDSELQFHSASPGGLARQGAIFHGHGDDDSDRRYKDVVRYFRLVVEALKEVPDPAAPMVLAAVEEHEPLLRQAGAPRQLLPSIVPGNHDRTSDEELAERAREVVARAARLGVEEALEAFRELGDRRRAAGDPAAVITAAAAGRIDTLFLVPGAQIWGRFQPQDPPTVRFHAVREDEDDDLVDLAVSMTLAQGGVVHALETPAAPEGGPLAAILRF